MSTSYPTKEEQSSQKETTEQIIANRHPMWDLPYSCTVSISTSSSTMASIIHYSQCYGHPNRPWNTVINGVRFYNVTPIATLRYRFQGNMSDVDAVKGQQEGRTPLLKWTVMSNRHTNVIVTLSSKSGHAHMSMPNTRKLGALLANKHSLAFCISRHATSCHVMPLNGGSIVIQTRYPANCSPAHVRSPPPVYTCT